MSESKLANSPAARLSEVRWPHLVVLGAVLLTYGFELFNFNVSVDEPLYWNMSRLEMLGVWNNQGRWGMGLTALLLPSTDVPVAPLALGLALSAGSFWWLSRRLMELGEWESALTTSLAVTLPALVFHFSFAINALGLGLAYAACAACTALARRPAWLPAIGAVSAGAFAIGIYEGFAFTLVAAYMALLWREPTLRMVLRTALLSAGSAASWFLIRASVLATLPSDKTGYVGGMLDVDGLVQHPVERAIDAASRTFGIIVERWLYLGYSNPLPALVVGVIFLAGAWGAWSRPRGERLLSIILLLALVIIPFVAALTTRVIFQRSMVYLPIIVVVVLGTGLPVLRSVSSVPLRRMAITVAVLAVVGNATLSNGIYYSGTMLYDEDLAVATNVAATYRSLPGSYEEPLSAVIAPRSDEYARPEAWSGRSSLELGVMGSAGEALRFLQMRGLDVRDPTEEEKGRGEQILETMPAYPEPGYLQVSDGLLLINLSSVDGR